VRANIELVFRFLFIFNDFPSKIGKKKSESRRELKIDGENFLTQFAFFVSMRAVKGSETEALGASLSFSTLLLLSCSAVGCWLFLHVNCHSTRLIPLEIHSGWWKFIETTNERNEQPKGRRGLSKLSSCDSVDLDSSSQNVASSNTKAQAL
jgi:hypothetical protein